jgi:PBSX family phage terminase large subunit
MLLSRLSVKGAKLIGTTNPDKPSHWLKKNYIDKQSELDILALKFLIDDNTFLDENYVENIKKEYSGVFRDRFIKGLWVVAQGGIYQYFNENKAKFIIDEINSKEIIYATIGVDFGGNGSAHAMVCNGYTRGFRQVITLDEYYKKGSEIKSPQQLENDFVEFVLRCKEKFKIADVYCDSAEQLLIKGFRIAAERNKLKVSVNNARKGSVLNRIRFFSRLMGAERYKVLRNCRHLIEAFESAVWNEKSLEDERLDNGTTNIDSLDALEYATEKLMNSILQVR